MIGFNQDLIVILAIAAFIFGAKRLPEIGKGLGKGIQEFKNGLAGQEDKAPSLQPAGGDQDLKTIKATDG
jgi:sec-independent protein translocase protein TatA